MFVVVVSFVCLFHSFASFICLTFVLCSFSVLVSCITICLSILFCLFIFYYKFVSCISLNHLFEVFVSSALFALVVVRVGGFDFSGFVVDV